MARLSERNFRRWKGLAPKSRDFETKWQRETSELLRATESLPDGGRFQLLILHGGCDVTAFSRKGPVRSGPRVRRDLEKLLRKWDCSGWCGPNQGLWAAYRTAGCDPFGIRVPDEPAVDVVYFFDEGAPAVGQIISVPAAIDDIRRHHRFFRIPIHNIRSGILEQGEPTMQGFAEITGGTYLRVVK